MIYIENIFIKFKYLVGIIVFLISNKMIWVIQARYINPKLREAICTINTLIFPSSTILANFFLLMILTYKVVNKALVAV